MLLLAAGCGAGHRASTATSTFTATVHTTIPPTSPAKTTTAIPPSNGAATAFLPAYFTVNADDSLTPPTISGPVATTILFTVTSHTSHTVQLTVASHTLSVAPGGHTSARIPPLKAGDYPITVNGAKRASLVIGVQPGP